MKMDSNKVLEEWKECRNSIARFDNYLLRLRTMGFSVFTVLFAIISGFTSRFSLNNDDSKSINSEMIIAALIGLSIYVLAIYILDRYYERMLLVSVFRATRLEALSLEGFQIGLTTEIQFEKDLLLERKNKILSKASTMVNIVYILILASISVFSYLVMLRNDFPLWSYIAYVFANIFIGIMIYSSNRLLKDPYRLIAFRSNIITSPIIMTKNEIDNALMNNAQKIFEWLRFGNYQKVYVISILQGGRMYADALVDKMQKIDGGVQIEIFPICVLASTGAELRKDGERSILFGCIPKNEYSADSPILVVDDLLDSGKSLSTVVELAKSNGWKNIKTTVLINKYNDQQEKVDYLGMNLALDSSKMRKNNIKDYWLFGYGMDYNGQYREIDHLGWIPIPFEDDGS